MARNALMGRARHLWSAGTPPLSQYMNSHNTRQMFHGSTTIRFSTKTAGEGPEIDYAAVAADLLSGPNLENEALENCKRRMKTRQINLLKPRPIYEGPINVAYWVRKKRAGLRK